MPELTAEGRGKVAEIAARHGVSPGAAETLLDALMRGNGNQAQFSHPELGGMGQWSRGGMIMVGDMFNNGLKARVDGLCHDLARMLGDGASFAPRPGLDVRGADSAGVSFFAPAASDWPSDLGSPSSSGAQNNMRYAVFPGTRRLAISQDGKVTVYDTGDHMIGGVSQAQSGDQTLSFTSQHGLVRLSDLPRIGEAAPEAHASAPATVAAEPAPARVDIPAPRAAPENAAAPRAPETPPAAPSAATPGQAANGGLDIIATIERLADLRSKGILTEEEFAAKKSELLSRM